MDGHRYVDTVNDTALDREIESLVDVEPSPEFVARVRARVAQEPEPGGWRVSWMLAVPAAVVVMIVAVLAWPSREATSSSDAPPRVAESARTITRPQTITPQTLPVPEPLRRRPEAVRVAVSAVERGRGIDIDLPEVVIAENEVRTFASLVASPRLSRFDVAVPAAPNPDTPLEIKELPPVEPLEIEPIVRVAVFQTEGERP